MARWRVRQWQVSGNGARGCSSACTSGVQKLVGFWDYPKIGNFVGVGSGTEFVFPKSGISW